MSAISSADFFTYARVVHDVGGIATAHINIAAFAT